MEKGDICGGAVTRVGTVVGEGQRGDDDQAISQIPNGHDT